MTEKLKLNLYGGEKVLPFPSKIKIKPIDLIPNTIRILSNFTPDELTGFIPKFAEAYDEMYDEKIKEFLDAGADI